jgi:hypothetical protein
MERQIRCQSGRVQMGGIEPEEIGRPDRREDEPETDRVSHDRRVEALSMIALWQKSTKPWAQDELKYWQALLRDIDGNAS